MANENAERDWLFAYGTLGPGLGMAPAHARWVADRVRGRLFDLGPHPALIDAGDLTAGWVEGHVRAVSARELRERFDPYEGVDEGLYRRVQVTTEAGRPVWVYEYARPLPPEARGPIGRWQARGIPPAVPER